MSICLVETNHVLLLSILQDSIRRRARSPPTPGRLALISKRNNIDKNKFNDSFVFDGENSCRISLRNIKN